MKSKSVIDGTKLLKKNPFFILVKENSELAEPRREHASMSARKRRMSADWEYNANLADELMYNSIRIDHRQIGVNKNNSY